jgi:hypothetical protein
VGDASKNFTKKCPWHSHLRHLERDEPRMPDHFGTNLDEFSRSVVSDHFFTDLGNASRLTKLPKL